MIDRLLLIVLAVSGVAVAARAVAGPFTFGLSVHSPMNPEGIFGLALVLLLWRRAGSKLADSCETAIGRWAGVLLVLLTGLAFCRFLAFPLLADDYSHIWNAHTAKLPDVIGYFTVPAADRFFRPLGYVSYALDAQWAGYAPFGWRLVNLLLHAVNSVLVWRLCLRLGVAARSALLGALLFAWHATRPEAVTWVAARFDLLAACFVLLTLLGVLEYSRSHWPAAMALTCAALVLGLLSKEAAYVAPLLAVLVLFYERLSWRDAARVTAPLWLLTLAVFAYRWRLLGGIGGYRNAGDGAPTILNLRLTTTLKGLLLRLWAGLLFPLNWTEEPGLLLSLALMGAMAGMAWLTWQHADRRKLALGLCLIVASALPVHQFLSFGPDLEKSRVLYLPTMGLALVFAAMCEQTAALWPAALVLAFQLFALQHNLDAWRRIGELADRTCATAAAAAQNGLPPVILDLPNVVDGVYFLHTGYPECALFRLPRTEQRPLPRKRSLVWDAAQRRLVEPVR